MSLPSWERGLKYGGNASSNLVPIVAPLVGAWIEIFENVFYSVPCFVAPLVGAWIEINVNTGSIEPISASLPSWERGLKLLILKVILKAPSRSPRGSVD